MYKIVEKRAKIRSNWWEPFDSPHFEPFLTLSIFNLGEKTLKTIFPCIKPCCRTEILKKIVLCQSVKGLLYDGGAICQWLLLSISLATCQVIQTRVGKSCKLFRTGMFFHKNIRQHVYFNGFLTNTMGNRKISIGIDEKSINR